MGNMPMGNGPIDAPGAVIKILSPTNGATITDSSVIVQVETSNLPLGKDGVHFHLYVDGKVQGMSDGANAFIMAHDLTAGEHTFEVVLANGLHQELKVSDRIKVNVQPTSAATPPTADMSSAVLMIGFVAAVANVGGIGVVVVRRK
jgi:hypothetical protein